MQHHSTFKTGFLVCYYCSKFYTFKVKLWKSTLLVCAVLLESVKFMLNTFGVSLLGFTLYYFIILYFCKWIFWILRYRKLFRYRFRARHHWINLLEVEVPQLQTNVSKLQQFFIKFERLVALGCKHKRKVIAWETCCGQWWISSMKNFLKPFNNFTFSNICNWIISGEASKVSFKSRFQFVSNLEEYNLIQSGCLINGVDKFSALCFFFKYFLQWLGYWVVWVLFSFLHF